MSNKRMKILTGVNLVLALISISALSVSIYVSTKNVNIGYVENNRVLHEYHGFIESSRLYENKLQQWKANMDTLEMEIDRDIKAYQQNFHTLSTKEKQLSEQLIASKKEKYYSYKSAVEEKAKEEDAKMTKALLNQIDSYLLEYGEDSEFDFIIGVTDQGNLLYARKNANITDEIIAGLNNKYEGIE